MFVYHEQLLDYFQDLCREIDMKKVGIVLEGGGMRGAYTAGVLSWLLKNNFKADIVVGISSGAMYGAFYAADQEELMKKAAIEIAPDKDNVGLRPFLREGQLVAYDRLYDQELYKAGFDNKRLLNSFAEFECGVYSLDSYTTLWKTNKDVAENGSWIKAACALPIFGRFVKIKDSLYTDGGVTTMIPVGRALEKEVDHLIVITTKSPEYVRPQFPKYQIWLLKNIIYRKHPQLVKDFLSRTEVYYQERKLVDELVRNKKALNLYPTRETGVTRYKGNRDQFENLFQLAYDNCEEHRQTIESFFKKETE